LKILEVEGVLHHNNYRKYVKAACEQNKFDLASYFISDYKLKLHPDFRESYYIFCKTTIHFYKKDYKKAIQTVNQLQPNSKDVFLKLFGRLLTAKIIYEARGMYKHLTNFRKEDSDTTFENYLQNVQRWIREDSQLTSDYQSYFKSFVDILLELFRIKINNTYKIEKGQRQLQKIAQQLEKTTNSIHEKKWLVTKTHELQLV